MKFDAGVEEMGKHYKIPGFDKMDLQEKLSSVKKVTGAENYSSAWKYYKSGGKAVTASKPATVTSADAKTEIITPGASTNTSHSVDVSAPQINVNIPAPVVTVSHGNLSWSHAIRQTLLWSNGYLMGGLTVALVFLWTAVNAAP